MSPKRVLLAWWSVADQHLPVGDVFLRRAEALDAGGIDRDDAVEWTVDFSRRLDDLIRVEETQFGGHRILIPNGDLLAPLEQGQRQTKDEPMQSPSGRMWLQTAMVWLSPITSRMRSMIFSRVDFIRVIAQESCSSSSRI